MAMDIEDNEERVETATAKIASLDRKQVPAPANTRQGISMIFAIQDGRSLLTFISQQVTF